ncbi:MAG: hypothetical protein AAB354_06000 [candidate division KSB1 bacterium]
MKSFLPRWQDCAAAFLLLLLGCTTPTLVRDVLELPPPENVRGERGEGIVTITWQAANADKPADFSGYLLYYAARSLTNVPLAAMPKVVELPDVATQYSFAFADSLPVFVHVRCRAGNGQVSLPSLPEVALPPEE